MSKRYRIEYLHHESSHWQGTGTFASPEEALEWIKAEGFPDFCDEIYLWDDTNAPDGVELVGEYCFDTGEWD